VRDPQLELQRTGALQAPLPPVGGITPGHALVLNVQVAVQVTAPAPMFIAAQLVVIGRVGSQDSPASRMPLPHTGPAPPAPPPPLALSVEARTHAHCVFHVPVGMHVLTAAYIGSRHIASFCGHGSEAERGTLLEFGTHDRSTAVGSSPPQLAAAKTDNSTTAPKPEARVYMVYIIRTNAPVHTRGEPSAKSQIAVIVAFFGDSPLCFATRRRLAVSRL
jgi:hypothetical protein